MSSRVPEQPCRDEARERLAQVVRPHRLTVIRGGAELRVVHHMAELGGATLHYVDYRADVEVSAEQGFVMVEMPLAGRVVLHAGSREIVATPEVAAVSSATDAPSIHYFADSPRLMIRIDPELLDSRPALALGDRPRQPVGSTMRWTSPRPGPDGPLAPRRGIVRARRSTGGPDAGRRTLPCRLRHRAGGLAMCGRSMTLGVQHPCN